MSGQGGQTSLEYLLLLSVSTLVAYLVIKGPASKFTAGIIEEILTGIQNVVAHAEWTPGTLEYRKGKHPTNPGRLKPVH